MISIKHVPYDLEKGQARRIGASGCIPCEHCFPLTYISVRGHFGFSLSSPNPGISPGDLASIEENAVPTGRSKKSAKPTSTSARDKVKSAVEGVVYKVFV